MPPPATLPGPPAAVGLVLGIPPPTPDVPGSLIGVEHEYALRRAGRPFDFRNLIHTLPIDGLRIDPADVNAYRCTNGMALTCDEAEAEVASPPVTVEPGFTVGVNAWARAGRSLLRALLPPDIAAQGYSTHLSVAMPDALNDEACELFAITFGPAVALLLEGPDSLGIYIRPRPGRLEVCGEFVEGARLGAVAAFVAGAARACAAAAAGTAHDALPPQLNCALLPGTERYGLRLHRHAAFGFDYYAAGRKALLPVAAGGTISAQALLESTWGAARQHLQPVAASADLAAMDSVVAGTLPLGVEAEFPPLDGACATPTSPFAAAVRTRRRGDLELRAVAATWETVVFRAARNGSVRFITIPRALLGLFVRRFDSGELDGALGESFASAVEPAPRGAAQLQTPGVYATAPDPSLLILPERDPETLGHPAGAKAGRSGKRGGSPSGARPGKAIPAGRPFKFVPPPFSRDEPVVPEPLPPPPVAPAPLPPEHAVPEPPPIPIPPPPAPDPTPPPPPPPLAPVPPPWRPSPLAVVLVAGAAAVAVAVGALAVLYDGGTGGGPKPTETAISTATNTAAAAITTPTPPAPTATPSPTPRPTETPAPTASPTTTAAAETVTPGAVVTQTPTSSPTRPPTDAPPATLTPLPSPSPTPTPTRPPTATPTRTPTKTPIPTLPPVFVGCTPSPGTTCPTPVP